MSDLQEMFGVIGAVLGFIGWLILVIPIWAIHGDIRRLVQLQEFALTRGSPQPMPEQRQPEPEATAQWSKL